MKIKATPPTFQQQTEVDERRGNTAALQAKTKVHESKKENPCNTAVLLKEVDEKSISKENKSKTAALLAPTKVAKPKSAR